MAFQFQCPQGHLLEGDESQAGQAIHCPVCQMLFLIPAPIAEAPQPQFQTASPEAASPFNSPAAPAEPEILHIPCPKGHVLEVPPDMLDTEVLCPQCGEQFELRAKNSIEHKKKKALQDALREERSNKFVLNFAITVAVIVVLMLLTLGIMTAVSIGKKDKAADKPVPAKVAPEPEKPAPPPMEEPPALPPPDSK